MDPTLSIVEDAIAKTGYFNENLEKLLSYLQPAFHCLNLIVKVLIHGPDGAGKRLIAKLAARSLSLNFCEERVADMFDENIVGTEKKVRAAISKFSSSSPCLIYLSGYELLCRLEDQDLDRIEQCIRDCLDEISANSSQPIIFIASTNDFIQVYHASLSDIFHHDVQIRPTSIFQASEIINSLKSSANLQSEACRSLEKIPKDELYIGNLLDLVARCEIELQEISAEEFKDLDRKVLEEDKRDQTRWVDIGGLRDVKSEIIDAIQFSLDYPQLKKSGLRRTGILLYGPPGTGKTLLAKAVATECNLNFINVKGPELLNEYVGQSEDNVRKLFRRARDSTPSVIFFDEIDSLAPNRGHAGDSGGVMDRMVSQLLAEMDGAGKTDGVFVIGATNRVDLVDPSLLRPGRFDKVLEVPLPANKESRLQILRALTRKMVLDEEVDLEKIELMSPPNMSGADFQGLCSRALIKAFNRCIEQVESGRMREEDVEVITTMGDFSQSLNE